MDPDFPPPTLLAADVRKRFSDALRNFDAQKPVLVMGHHDADGLSATALLVRALRSSGREVITRIVGRGENPWSKSMAAELEPLALAGLMVADLGVRPGTIKSDAPTIIIDHHVPSTALADGAVISGYGHSPVPTSSLLAFWCASEIADADRWLWIAAIGLIGDMAEGADFPELSLARKRYGITALREATTLINAPRRSASGDASPALHLLLHAESPKDLLSGRYPETAKLQAAREEVKAAMAGARRIAPKVRNGVALILFDSPCQIHPLIAQQWRGRLKNEIVLAANTGYRPGWIHFAARSARDVDLIEFLAEHKPAGADENYGSGHVAATGGALRPDDWNAFIVGLGFGPESQVQP
ncbi:MAG TPA: DHH family phosphoesterase [Candidatus Limnocylindrales bacterium]|nr:DHH family phosphoesterase [Candidatus Limnocylindrales bacterium]